MLSLLVFIGEAVRERLRSEEDVPVGRGRITENSHGKAMNKIVRHYPASVMRRKCATTSARMRG